MKIKLVVIAVVISLGLVGFYFIQSNNDNGEGDVSEVTLYFDTQYSNTGWTVTIVNISSNTGYYSADPATTKYLTGTNSTQGYIYDEGFFSNISSSKSKLGIQWIDVDNDNLLKVGDYLKVDIDGGTEGKLSANHEIQFLTAYSYSPSVWLTPDSLMELAVESYDNGWNITIINLNDTIPDDYLMWSKMFDQIEDDLGNIIDVTYGETNIPYNRTWIDTDNNSFLSVGDVINIDKTDDTLKPGYTYRLISKIYGYHHTYDDIVLE